MSGSKVAELDVVLNDGLTGAAQQMAGALNQVGDAADRAQASVGALSSTTERVSTGGMSLSRLLKMSDPVTRATMQHDAATRQLENGIRNLDTSLASGAISQEQHANGIAYLRQRALAARTALEQLTVASGSAAEGALASVGAHEAAAVAMEKAHHAGAGYYRELVVMGHEAITGRFSRIPGSMMVLAERSGNLESIIHGTVAAATSLAGVLTISGVAGVAAMTMMAVSAEDANLKVVALADQLRATRSDYTGLAQVANAGAYQFAAGSGASLADSQAASQSIVAQPFFSGSGADLQGELTLAQNLALVWNVTLPEAAKRLAVALNDPMVAAENLAKEGFPSMTEATLQTIQALEEQGNYIEADRVLLDAYGKTADGATATLTPFGQAMHDLKTSFEGVADVVGAAAHSFGNFVLAGVGAAIEGVAALMNGLNAVSDWIASHAGGAGNSAAPINPMAPGYRSPMQRLQDASGTAAAAGPPAPDAAATAAASAQAAQDQRVLLEADKLSASTESARTEVLRNENVELQKAADLAAAAGLSTDRYTQQIAKNKDEITKLSTATAAHSAELSKSITQIDNSAIDNAELAAAYDKGYAAVQRATAGTKALAEATRIYGADVGNHPAAVAQLTDAYTQQISSGGDLRLAQSNLSSQNTLAYLHAETASMGENATQRAVMLAGLKAEQQARADNGGALTAEGALYVQNAEDAAQATAEYQHQTQVVNDLTGMGTQAFDQLGMSITNAFTMGAGKAVDWANIFKATTATVLQQVAKLAVIGPTLNSIFGTQNVTASDVLGLGSGGGSQGGGSITGLMNDASNLSSLSNATGFSPMNSGAVSDFLGQSVWAGTATGANTAASALYGGADGGAAALGIGEGSGVSLGAAGSGVGMGVGGGMMLNSALGGSTGGGAIGSTGGAAAGAIIGSIVPGIGTMLGAVIGGLAGGGLAALISSAGEQHKGWNVHITTDPNGLLGIGSYGFPSEVYPSQTLDPINAALTSLDNSLSKSGLTVNVPQGGLILGAQNAGPLTPSSINSSAAFSQLRFSSRNDPALNAALQGMSFNSEAQLSTFTSFMTGSYETLTNSGGALARSLQDLNAKFIDAIETAKEYGLATGALVTAQATADQQAQYTANITLNGQEGGMVAKALSAEATIYGGSGGQQAQLIEFNINALQQQNALQMQLIAAYGESYTATADYARIMGEYNQMVSDQKAALLNAPAEAAAGTAGGYISSLDSFVQNLLTGGDNPASPMAKFGAAQSNWQSISAGALGGNAIDLKDLQAAASTYLTGAKSVYGVGQRYADVFESVTGILDKISQTPTDVLTASLMQQALQTNTQTLVQNLQILHNDLLLLNSTVQQNLLSPARILA